MVTEAKKAVTMYDFGESIAYGRSIEEQFLEVVKRRGLEVREANKDENINKHWDFLVLWDGKEVTIDVKGMKSLCRGQAPQDEYTCLELHGVRENDKGWLYGGHANYIAFETKTSYLIVDRVGLAAFADWVIHWGVLVSKSNQAMYTTFNRRDHDLISWIETSRLRESWLLVDEWPKGE